MSKATSLRPLLLIAGLFLAAIPFLQAQTGVPETDEKDAAETTKPLDPELASPQDTLITFLKGIEAAQGSKDELQWEKVYKTIEIAPSAGNARKDAALRLHRIISGLGDITPETLAPNPDETEEDRLERFELFPGNPREAASEAFKEKFGELEEEIPGTIVLAHKPGTGWLFNAETVDSINPLAGWMEEQGVDALDVDDDRPLADVIRDFVPAWAKNRFVLGLEIWQWVALSLITLISVLTYLVGTIFLGRIFSHLWKKFRGETIDRDRARIARPVALILGSLVFIALLKFLGIIGISLAVFLLAGRLTLVAGVTWTAWSLTNFLTDVWARYAEETESTFDDMMVPLVRKTFKLIIVIWAIVYIAASIDILNFVTPLLAGFGLAGLAVSFAAQDLIRNLFGGVTIFLDRPFQVGERIVLDGHDGIVEEIGFRSSRLRTKDGYLVTVPNGTITSNSVENIGRRPAIRRDFSIGVTYDTSPERIAQVIDLIQEILARPEFRDHLSPSVKGKALTPKVFFENFGDSALLIRIVYWYEGSGYWDFKEHSGKVNLTILKELNDLGIEIAFPTQTIHLSADAPPQDRS